MVANDFCSGFWFTSVPVVSCLASLAGIILNSAVLMAIRLSTQRVWHTFNYDVSNSNDVNLCHPILAKFRR